MLVVAVAVAVSLAVGTTFGQIVKMLKTLPRDFIWYLSSVLLCLGRVTDTLGIVHRQTHI